MADTTKDFLLAEFAQLKAEILKRSEIQHQLISITLVALGGLAAVGLKDSPPALLAYPLLALFLGASWSYNDIQIAQIGIYIKYRIEERLLDPPMGWEHRGNPSRVPSRQIGAMTKFATRGILWGSEFLAITLYLLKRLGVPWPTVRERKAEFVILGISVLATFCTMWVMRNRDAIVEEIETNMKTAAEQRPAQDGPICLC
jgi:hypothetical protein